MKNVLVIEDDLNVCEVLAYYLRKDGKYSVSFVHTAEEGISLVRTGEYDIILSDIMLPGMDGIAFCQKVREMVFIPIIFISCLDDDATIIKALNMGGDDYLVKPFHGPVLLAHIEAALRRCTTKPDMVEVLEFGELSLDSVSHKVTRSGRELYLSPTECDLLWFLARRAGAFVTYEELYTGVWKKPSLGDYRSLFVHISNLRKKIETDPSNPVLLKTHPQGGYLFSGK